MRATCMARAASPDSPQEARSAGRVADDHALHYIAYPAITVLSDGRVKNVPFSPTQQDFNVGFLRMAE